MPIYGAKDVSFFMVGGQDLVGPGLVVGLNDGGVEELVDVVSPFGKVWSDAYDTGIAKENDVVLETLYDDGTVGTRLAFVGQHGSKRVVVYAVAGNVIGREFQGFGGSIETKNARVAQFDKIHRDNVTFLGNAPADVGYILHPFATETSAGNTESSSDDWVTKGRARGGAIATSSVANPTVITTTHPNKLTSGQVIVISGHTGSTPSINGSRTVTVLSPTTFSIPVNVTVGGTAGTFTVASVITGGAGYVAVDKLTLGGYTNLTVKVRHSADNATFADLLTFTPIAAAPAAERKVVNGTINRYTASSWAFTGSGSSPSAKFFVGLARNAGQ